MKQTIVTLFDSFEDAANAIERLAQAGICRSVIRVYARGPENVIVDELLEKMTSTRSPTANFAEGTEAIETIGSGRTRYVGAPSDITLALERLRDAAQLSDEIGHHHEAIRRGYALLLIEAVEQTEVKNVTSVLHNLPTIDMDERAAQWARWGYVNGDIGARAFTAQQVSTDRHAFPIDKRERSAGQGECLTYGVRLYPHLRDSTTAAGREARGWP